MIQRFEAHVEAVLMTMNPEFYITGRVELRSAAMRRGIVCSAECPGEICQDDTLSIVIADA